MVTAVEKAEIEVLKAYPGDKIWNVVITFPDELDGFRSNINVKGSLDFALYQIQGWTDEPVDLNEMQLMAYNESKREYKLVKGDDEDVPENVQMELLSAAREAMLNAEDALSSN